MATRPPTMRAVVYKGIGEVAVEDRPTPQIQTPKDAVLKVTHSAVCGSDLHFYRGHMNVSEPGFICGHEFVGIIEEIGSNVKEFSVGQQVVVPFFTACGTCFFCEHGFSSRCTEGQSFGLPLARYVDGGQAQYVRIPNADGTLVLAPNNIPKEMLVLMADIFSTGYFAAQRFLCNMSVEEAQRTVCVVLGCGPVGCCAIASAQYLAKGSKVFAVDMVADRLAEAEKLGATPLDLNNRNDSVIESIKTATGGRGADVIMEIVGSPDALKLSLDLVRPFGKISSVGVHTSGFNITPADIYAKNATLALGRSPARSLFEESLPVLEAYQDKLNFLVGRKMKLEDAAEAYRLFDQRKIHKVIFDMD